MNTSLMRPTLFVLYFFWISQIFYMHYGVEGIIGGNLADIEEFRYKVSIQSLGNVNHACGGVILHPDWILTSAVCIAAAPPMDLVVAVGAENFLDPEALHHGLSSHFPDITDMFNNDIALVKLAEPINLDEDTAAAILPTSHTEHNTVGTVAGWGTTEVGTQDNTLLYHLKQLVVGGFMCGIALDTDIPEGQMCATNLYGTGLCHGDEGAPLMTDDGVVLGVASNRLSCGDGTPNLYTRVFTHRDWIMNTIRNN